MIDYFVSHDRPQDVWVLVHPVHILFTFLQEFYVHVTVHRNKVLYNKTNQMHQFPKFTPA